MALEGTIKDIGLGDIFQLIGIQRKTGALLFDSGSEQVTVKFLDGSVVGAESHNHNLEDLLGSVLVRTGLIAQSQLEAALKIQKNTLQRLGHVLVESGFISTEDLQEALRTQVTQIVYRLFRWRAGTYRFTPVDNMDYDRNFMPVGAETILMEGARMVDEWPILERKIRSEEMVFSKTSATVGLDIPVESIVDADIDMESVFAGEDDPEPSKPESDEIRLSREETEILRMVDGAASVREIVDRSALGEFDTYRILHELLTRNLIEEVQVETGDNVPAKNRNRSSALWTALSLGVVAVAILVGALMATENDFGPWETAGRDGALDRLRTFASRDRVQRVERALNLCFLDTGQLPTDLTVLVDNGYLDPGDIQDPWGRRYGYMLGEDRYTLIALDPQGAPDQGLTVNRPFSPAMRMVLDGGSPSP